MKGTEVVTAMNLCVPLVHALCVVHECIVWVVCKGCSAACVFASCVIDVGDRIGRPGSCQGFGSSARWYQGQEISRPKVH